MQLSSFVDGATFHHMWVIGIDDDEHKHCVVKNHSIQIMDEKNPSTFMKNWFFCKNKKKTLKIWTIKEKYLNKRGWGGGG